MVEILILGKRHGAAPDAARDVIAGPTTGYSEVKALYKKMVVAHTHPEWAEIDIGTFSSDRKAKLLPVVTETVPQPKRKKKNEETV